MTNSVALQMAIEALGANADFAEVCEKLTNIKASIDKKNSHKSDKPTAKQTENVGFKAEILEYLGTVEKATITDLIKGITSLNELSNQRVSAIVRQMVLDGSVIRVEEKRKAYFSLPSEVED